MYVPDVLPNGRINERLNHHLSVNHLQFPGTCSKLVASSSLQTMQMEPVAMESGLRHNLPSRTLMQNQYLLAVLAHVQTMANALTYDVSNDVVHVPLSSHEHGSPHQVQHPECLQAQERFSPLTRSHHPVKSKKSLCLLRLFPERVTSAKIP